MPPLLRRILPLLAAVVALIAFFGLCVPEGRFLTTANLIDLAQQISVNAILAFGMTLVILIGGIDLSVGSLLGGWATHGTRYRPRQVTAAPPK